MSNQLIPVQGYDVQTLANAQMFADIAKSSATFLPRLQLLTAASSIVKERKFPADHYGLFRRKDLLEDLGAKVDCIPITVRAKAIRGLKDDEQFTFYDQNHPEFKKIMVESEEKDSGAMFGPEFLTWLVDEKELCQFFCGSKSSRLESQVLFSILQQGKAATLDSRIIKTPRHTWVAPAISVCSIPINPDQLPSNNGVDINAEVKRFLEIKSSTFETADESADNRPR